MNCERCQIDLEDLLYGELSEARAAAVRAHLAACAECRAAQAGLEREAEIFAAYYEQNALEPSEEMWDAIRARIQDEPRRRKYERAVSEAANQVTASLRQSFQRCSTVQWVENRPRETPERITHKPKRHQDEQDFTKPLAAYKLDSPHQVFGLPAQANCNVNSYDADDGKQKPAHQITEAWQPFNPTGSLQRFLSGG